jgi:amino acid adenylation domain-containing protein
MFEAVAALTPNAVAVCFEERSWTYGELNERANRIAAYLRDRGVGPEVMVGLWMDRSLDLVAALLGILKAGGAYVPIDPAYPADRLAFILEETRVPVLLTQQRLVPEMPDHRAEVVCLDADWPAIARGNGDNVPSGVGPDHLAYVIYTSGSTGKPKGALITHDNVTRLFTQTEAWFHFDAGDVWTLFHSFAFDFSVWEIWGALAYGGRLVVVPYLASRSPEVFYELLRKEEVTVLNQTPSAFRQLMRAEAAAPAGPPLALRYVIFGGEALEMQSLRPWFERHGDQRPQLVNMYGITETTVHVTYRPLSLADLARPSSVIGGPIPDLSIHILDPESRLPVAPGVMGEMYVGGAGLARGYLHRPELTAERFLPDPFTGRPGDRLYKTGDLARMLPGGDLEYLGRIDHQVKIRGFRIELPEIESVIAQHPDVHESVVTAREDGPGEKRLVAYVVARAGRSVAVADLRELLRKKVPEYMVPSAFVMLASLPLTVNGKVDRKQLPAPPLDRPETGEAFVAPQSETEVRVAQIWEDVLKVRPVGLRDNFFDLGGDSLLAVTMFERVKREFDRDLPLAILFEGGTVEHLVGVMREPPSAERWTPVVPIQPHGSHPPFFCVHAIGGEVLSYARLGQHLAPDQPLIGLQAVGVDSRSDPLETIEAMAAVYVEAIRARQPQGPYHLGGYSSGGTIAFEMAQQLRARGEQVAFLGIIDDGPVTLYRSARWSLEFVTGFLANLPHWFREDLAARSPGELLDEVFRKLRVWGRKLGWVSGLSIDEVLDVSRMPERRRQFYETHYRALKAYEPKPYPGRVTLFRARAQPLFCSHARDMEWRQLAADGVEVVVVPGGHETVLSEPNVRAVAQALRARLQSAGQ